VLSREVRFEPTSLRMPYIKGRTNPGLIRYSEEYPEDARGIR
jgi:hypothetical protein